MQKASDAEGVDALFTGFAYASDHDGEIKSKYSRWFGKKIPFDQMLFGYQCLFDIDGNSYSQRLKHYLLSTAAIIKMESPYTEFFTAFLQPWKHFIPMQYDFVDMSSAVDFLVNNPETAGNITVQGDCFIREHLEMENVKLYIQTLLWEYTNLIWGGPDLHTYGMWTHDARNEGEKVFRHKRIWHLTKNIYRATIESTVKGTRHGLVYDAV
jgi:hypothetical protein